MMGNSTTRRVTMDLSIAFPADADKAKDGVSVKVAGITWVLTYYNSTVAQISFQANIKKNEASDNNKQVVIDAMRETLVDDIVLGWEDLQDEGKTIEYSKPELERLLEKYVGLDVELMDAASQIENFKRDQIEETAKN